jgi:ribosomal protein L14E/L6E/L27E
MLNDYLTPPHNNDGLVAATPMAPYRLGRRQQQQSVHDDIQKQHQLQLQQPQSDDDEPPTPPAPRRQLFGFGFLRSAFSPKGPAAVTTTVISGNHPVGASFAKKRKEKTMTMMIATCNSNQIKTEQQEWDELKKVERNTQPPQQHDAMVEVMRMQPNTQFKEGEDMTAISNWKTQIVQLQKDRLDLKEENQQLREENTTLTMDLAQAQMKIDELLRKFNA